MLENSGISIPEDLTREKIRLEASQHIDAGEYIFRTMKGLNKFMTDEKETVVRNMAQELMKESEDAAQPCLLLGKVQCGKTDTFLSIMGLCFDKGIDIAIVMTKGTNTLTSQTLKRLRKDFKFFADNGSYDQKVIINIEDILDLYKKGGLTENQLNNPVNKFIIVVKKESTNLEYINELFDRSGLMRSKKVLICDDEADFASRAYLKRKNQLSLLRIAELIESLIQKPSYCRYLQITATPYSLFLQPDGSPQLRDGEEASPWLPRHVELVPIHGRYIGGKQYYELSKDEESMYSCLYESVTDECNALMSDRNEFYLDSNIHSDKLTPLNYSIVCYMFSAAVRSIQHKAKTNLRYQSSCLIHCEIAKTNHDWQAELVTKIINSVRDIILHNNSDLHVLDLENRAYNSLKYSNELGVKQGLINEPFPTFSDTLAEVKRILEMGDLKINVVNSEEQGKVATMLDDRGQLKLTNTLNFFIGGSILDRGITIDNMLCFFYGRDPKKFQMDTVLQHARMYGARDKEDMACTRFFTTPDIYSVLSKINEIDDCMYKYLKAHKSEVQSDSFLSVVIGWDKRINSTAKNKYTPANTKVVKPHDRILPKGFQTGTAAEISDTVNAITTMLKSCDGYTTVQEGGSAFFMMDANMAADIIKMASGTYVYGEEFHNVGYEFDYNEMLPALDRAVFDTDGQIYCQVFTNHNMNRERSNINDKRGRFVDSPLSGAAYAKAREIAEERALLMLIQHNGKVENGWRGTPFYWPVLIMPETLNPGIFTINDKVKQRKVKEQWRLPELANIDPKDVLHLTIGQEPFDEIVSGRKPVEFRDLKETTKSLYLDRDDRGRYLLADGVAEGNYTVKSFNNGVMPFKMRKYKYMYIRTSHDFSGDQALLELDPNKFYDLDHSPITDRDRIYDANNSRTQVERNENCNWVIVYRISKVVAFKVVD